MTNGGEELDLLAAEYVLGTLDAAERERIAADMPGNRELRLAVAWWEERLGRIGLLLSPVSPPSRTWRRIRARLDTTGGTRLRLWQGWAMAATVAAATLGGLLLLTLPEPQTPPPAYASMIHDAPTGAGWMLTAQAGDEDLDVTAIHDYPLPADKSLHLWLLPPEGGPVSLGLMPVHGEEHMPMPEGAEGMLRAGASFAVSLEPPGGSPEPVPTGRIMWVAPITSRSG